MGQLMGSIVCHPYELMLYRDQISAYLAEVPKTWPLQNCQCQEEPPAMVRDMLYSYFCPF